MAVQLQEDRLAKLTAALQVPPLQALAQQAEATGQELYVIGGYVRDYLLNRPCKDIDVVVVGDGPAAAQAFSERVGSHNVAIFKTYGTAMVRHGDYAVEFVGARKESYQEDSRKPSVTPGTLHDDQLRRDFTINALSISLNPNTYGQLMDPFGGVDDLREGLIRTPTNPDITFSDDPLRMLRAVRFATRFGYQLVPATEDALKRHAHRLAIISQERITEELNKLLAADAPGWGFRQLFRAELLHLFFPELVALQGIERREGIGHKDNFYHTLQVLDNLAAVSDNLWLRWAALLHDIGKPRTKRFTPEFGWSFHGHEDVGGRMVPILFRRLKLPLGQEMRYVQKLVKLHQRPIALAGGEVTDSAIRRIVVDAAEDLDDLLTLCRADITTRSPKREAQYLANYDALEQRIHDVLERDALRNWQPPIDGQDIMAAFNLRPGPEVGRLKNAVREAILDGEIPNDREAALDYVRAQAKAMGLASYS